MHSSKQTIFILTLLFVPVLLSAQNWCCIKKNSLNYFQCSNGDYKAIKIKTVQVVGSDSVLFPVKESNYIYKNWCGYIDTKSIVGMKMSIKPNGNNIFYDSPGLEFEIHTLANKGDNWTFFLFKDSSRFVAKVDSIYFNQIISGFSDSVKVISFRYVDKYGNIITHPANDARIRISKNYGFIKFWNFISLTKTSSKYSFLTYTLAGMSHPKVGYQNLDASLIYNFNVGDEFHIKDYFSQSETDIMTYSGGFISNLSCIKKIIDKSETNDTFYYKVYRHQYKIDFSYSHYVFSDSTKTYDTINECDTIIEKYSKSNTDLERLPLEAQITVWFCSHGNQGYQLNSYKHTITFGNIKTKLNDIGKQLRFELDDSCLSECNDFYDDYENYYEGLGGPYYLHTGKPEDPWIDPSIKYFDSNNLVYFKKGTKKWGTPLFIIDPNVALPVNPFYIAPNPVSTSFKVFSCSNKIINQIVINDLNGKRIRALSNINSPYYEIDCSIMNKGLYIVSIISGSEVFRKRLIIMR